MGLKIKQTFYDWCIENNRQDILNLWDYDLNNKTPKDVGSGSNLRYWFKCNRGIHNSELHYIGPFIQYPNTKSRCIKCDSLAQYLIDIYDEEKFTYIWSDKNTVDPWIVNRNSHTKVWVNLCDNPKHTHDQYVFNITKGVGCPFCSGKRVLSEESFGSLYPKVFLYWSDKNKKTPYEYSVHSEQKVWIKCINNIHNEHRRRICDMVKGQIGCAMCNRYTSKTSIDLTGERFGYLIVIGTDPSDTRRCLCICDCQNDEENPQPKSILRSHLVSGKIVSCGCYFIERMSGANNWSWKGGITPENASIRTSAEYHAWQNAVTKRDYYTCQCCGKYHSSDLSVHHIFPFSDYEGLRLNVDNGICLCSECHSNTVKGSFHNTYGTKNNTPEQLREYIFNRTGKDIYETHPQILHLIQNNT